MIKKENIIKGKTAKSNNFIFSVILGIICGISITLILSILLSALSLKIKNPINVSAILSIICVAFGGVGCSLVSSSTYKKNPLLTSLTSLAILSITCILSALNSESYSIINMIFFPLIIIVLGMITTLITCGANKKKKVKKYLK